MNMKLVVAPLRGERTTSHILHRASPDEGPSTFRHVFSVAQSVLAQSAAGREMLDRVPRDGTDAPGGNRTPAPRADTDAEVL